MQVSRRRCWQRVGGLLCLWPWGVVPGQAQAAAPKDLPADARQWLARIQEAAENRNYQGTLVFMAAGAVSSSRVLHYCDGTQRYERVEMLDGQVRQILRHNDQVQIVWPRTRVAVIEQRDPVAAFPALVTGDTRVPETYELQLGGQERVAGHEAQVLWFKPRDALRFGQRLWVESGSGLMLRADMLSPKGEVLESAAFSNLTIGGKPQPDVVLGPMKKLDGYRVLRPSVGRTHLEAEGWTLSGTVPAGFQAVTCFRRPLDAAAGAQAGASGNVLQSVYSDGLTHVSLFLEAHDPQRHKVMRTASGAAHTLTQKIDDWWLTVVGDVPMATVEQFAAALKRRV